MARGLRVRRLTRGTGLLSLVLAAVCAVGGCALWGPEGGPGGAGIAAPPGMASTTEEVVDAMPGADGVQRVEVTASADLRFTPSWVRARLGVIEIVFHNAGGIPHAAVVEVGVGGPTPSTGNLNRGQRHAVRMTIQQPGHYPFPCVYHVSSGMRGTLEVVAG